MPSEPHGQMERSPGARRDISHPQCDLGKLRHLRLREYAIRFLFGGAISVVVALVANSTTPRFGGVFAAFPAVLLASLTLIGEHEGIEPSVEDAQGAILGAIALVATAAYIAATLSRMPGLVSLLSALVLWLVLAGALYRLVIQRGVLRTYTGERERQERLDRERQARRDQTKH